MGAADGVGDQVREIVRRYAPTAEGDLSPGLPLGEGGLAFDSVRVVELLLECEERLGGAFLEFFTDQSQVTVGALVEFAEQQTKV